MSRTYSHRPHWVKLNDPKTPTKERHQHYVVKKEKVGEELVETYAWRRDLDMPKHTYTRAIYYRWTEQVPCTIDIPEHSWQDRSKYPDKLCDKRLLFTVGCPCCSRRYTKRLTNGARRSKVNQAMNSAVRDLGKWILLPDDVIAYDEAWDDVDINPVSKYDSPYWWD